MVCPRPEFRDGCTKVVLISSFDRSGNCETMRRIFCREPLNLYDASVGF